MNQLSQTSAQTSTEKTTHSRQVLHRLTERTVSLAFWDYYLTDAGRKEIILIDFLTAGAFKPMKSAVSSPCL